MRYIKLSLILLALICESSLFAAPPTDKNNVNRKMMTLKKECEVFENIINTTLRQSFPHPLLLSEKARGTYLAGYGLTFSFTVNLNNGYMLFPTTKKPYMKKSKYDTKAILNLIKRKIMDVVTMYGVGLKQLSSDEKISIIAHVLNRSVFSDVDSNRVMVLTVTKGDIDRLQRRAIKYEDFKKRVNYIEY